MNVGNFGLNRRSESDCCIEMNYCVHRKALWCLMSTLQAFV